MTEEELTGDWRDIYIRAYEHAAAERKALQQTDADLHIVSGETKAEIEALAKSSMKCEAEQGSWYLMGSIAAQSQQAKELEAIAPSGVWVYPGSADYTYYPAPLAPRLPWPPQVDVTAALGKAGDAGARAPVTDWKAEAEKKPGDFYRYSANQDALVNVETGQPWPDDGLKPAKARSILTFRAIALREKADAANIFDSERIKYSFAARELEKLVEELKAL